MSRNMACFIIINRLHLQSCSRNNNDLIKELSEKTLDNAESVLDIWDLSENTDYSCAEDVLENKLPSLVLLM